MSSQERASKRATVELPVTYRFNQRSNIGTIRDLSQHGARIDSLEVCPQVGASCTLEPFLEDGSAGARIKARVVRATEGPGFAVEFLEVDPDAFRVLARLQGQRARQRPRRQLKRKLKQVTVHFETETAEGEGHIASLNLDGLVIRSEAPAQPGEIARVVFRDLMERPVEVCGTVRWRRGPGENNAAGFCVKLDEITDEYLAFYNQALTW